MEQLDFPEEKKFEILHGRCAASYLMTLLKTNHGREIMPRRPKAAAHSVMLIIVYIRYMRTARNRQLSHTQKCHQKVTFHA